MTSVREAMTVVIKDGGTVKVRRKPRERIAGPNGPVDARKIDPRVWEKAMELAGGNGRLIRAVPGTNDAVRVVNHENDR